MAVCESHLESGLARLNREGSDDTSQERTLPAGLPLTVDYRSPVSHFVPPAVELYARHKQDQNVSSAESSETTTPVKRKRGRPRVDKTSPEYLANLAARKQAREMAAMARGATDTPPGEKRKRGRPRVDKTSPEYLARKRARELEALERKAKREYKRRTGAANDITNNIPPANIQHLTNNRNMAGNRNVASNAAGIRNVANSTAGNRNVANITAGNRNVAINTAGNRNVAINTTGNRNVAINTTGNRNVAINTTGNRNVANTTAGNRNVAINTAGNRNVANNTADNRNVANNTAGNRNVASKNMINNSVNRSVANRTVSNDKNLANRPVASDKNLANRAVANSRNVASNKRPPPRPAKRLPPAKNKVAARKLSQKSGKVAPPRKIATKNVVVRRNPKFSKAKRKDSGASSSTGDTTPRVKRKYTKRTPSQKKNDGMPGTERVKGKRGRPRKNDPMNANRHQQPKIRVRNNLMPINNEPISLDSDDEPDLGSPGAASDSLSLDENLRALRHLHEKYANIDKDEMFESHLLAANFKKPTDSRGHDDDVLSIRSSEGGNSVKEMDTRVEKLEDSSGSDSDSSSSGSGSSSSGSSSSSSCSSSSSDSSDSETETNHVDQNSTYSAPAWAAPAFEPPMDSASDSDPERSREAATGAGSHDEISESDNESPDKSFQCHICRKWYSTKVTLKIHRRSHQSRGGNAPRSRQRSSDRYECDICSEAFPRREKLYAHKADAHRGAMTVRCEVCRRCFEHDDELAAHRDQHTDDERNGRCSECGSVFPRFEQLRRHRACAHPSLPPAACEGAAGALPHACAHCGKRFSNVHSLTRHLHNHAKQLYRCVVCKASFAKAEQLAQHLNSHLANYKRLKP